MYSCILDTIETWEISSIMIIDIVSNRILSYHLERFQQVHK